ncbi:hypothetical protein DFH09DRAFT_1440975 [Mycena vulgaris]|nr:hypothetical protein DFH09DRAFT_1440975 [Mycena vulgaris]
MHADPGAEGYNLNATSLFLDFALTGCSTTLLSSPVDALPFFAPSTFLCLALGRSSSSSSSLPLRLPQIEDAAPLPPAIAHLILVLDDIEHDLVMQPLRRLGRRSATGRSPPRARVGRKCAHARGGAPVCVTSDRSHGCSTSRAVIYPAVADLRARQVRKEHWRRAHTERHRARHIALNTAKRPQSAQTARAPHARPPPALRVRLPP